MLILTPGIEREESAGGGSTFLENFKKALKPLGYTFTSNPEDNFDFLFIAGASLCDRSILQKAKERNVPIVLRVDNILEDRKNRNGGMPKMREYAAVADVVVYQSEWSKKFLSPVLARKDGMVIKNGVDTLIFHPDKDRRIKDKKESHSFIYTKYSRGEGKHFEVVQQWWREHSLHRPQDVLLLAGRFADEYFKVDHKFEFHNNEKFIYLGTAKTQEEMAEWYRSADAAVLPYFSDACSNSILEAQACGLYTLYDRSGGTPEIIFNGEELRMDIHSNNERLIETIGFAKIGFDFALFEENLGIGYMGAKYDALFRTIQLSNNEVEIV